jgi:hypothetical protein
LVEETRLKRINPTTNCLSVPFEGEERTKQNISTSNFTNINFRTASILQTVNISTLEDCVNERAET